MRPGVCKRGHHLAPDNVVAGERKVIAADGTVAFLPSRQCRRCRLAYREQLRRAAGMHKRRRPTHCAGGHPFTPENTITEKQVRCGARGLSVTWRRKCRICRNMTDRLRKERKREQRKDAP